MHIILLYLQDQYTPLYTASAKGFNDVVKSLVVANADVNCICKVSYKLAIAMYVYIPVPDSMLLIEEYMYIILYYVDDYMIL